MYIDLFWAFGALVGVAGALMDGRYLASFVWVGIGAYALVNYFEKRLKGSKYDW